MSKRVSKQTAEEMAAVAVNNYLSSSEDHSDYAVAAELRPFFRAAVAAERERCSLVAENAAWPEWGSEAKMRAFDIATTIRRDPEPEQREGKVAS